MTDGPFEGWHWREWLAEAIGTAVLLFAVVTAKFWAVQARIADVTVRIAIVAVVAGAVVALIAFTRLGRRSGAHLNPAVTFGLWLQKTVSDGDLVAYCLAQTGGGIAGVALARLWDEGVTRGAVNWAVITPGDGISTIAAATIEAAATFLILGAVFFALVNERLVRFAAIIGGAALTVLIVALARVSGAGFNPVRGLAPDVLGASYPAIWIYFAGPLAGSAAAAGAVLARGCLPLTGKLHHDPTMPCYMRCVLPHVNPLPNKKEARNESARATVA